MPEKILQFRQVEVEDYRCFHEQQVAQLAPLTFLVGENSTGKSSFLALLRALWDVAYGHRAPDFREPPYDLGTFPDIAHERGRRGGRATAFSAGFHARNSTKAQSAAETEFKVRFENRKTFPFPAYRRIESGDFWFESSSLQKEAPYVRFGSPRGRWRVESGVAHVLSQEKGEPWLPAHLLFFTLAGRFRLPKTEAGTSGFTDVQPDEGGADPFTAAEFEQIYQLLMNVELASTTRPYASAPVRTYPQRTYDPTRPSANPEGKDTPSFLSDLRHRDPQEWDRLKAQLEKFGQTSGLFDEISVKQLTKTGGGPFQIQVRRFGGKAKGPLRNLIDVGYGVSQALPIFAELLRHDAPSLFLLQQPEVHLHPTAQAALGDLLCDTAARGKQVVVETHSDYIVNRVRMDIRDGKTSLGPRDVSLLFFERRGLDVHIHSLRYDQHGNVLNAPPGYRTFFMEETRRSIGP